MWAVVVAGSPAVLLLPGRVTDRPDDPELRIAFDFDGVPGPVAVLF